MLPNAPHLHAVTENGCLVLRLSGDWTSTNARALDDDISALLAAPPGDGSVARLDATNLRRFDTYGAWLILRLERGLSSHGLHCEPPRLPTNFMRLFEAVRSTAPQSATPPRKSFWAAADSSLEQWALNLAQSVIGFLGVLGALAATLLRALIDPRRIRLAATVHQLDRVGWRAVPIILLITFLIGGIIAQQGFFHFRKFGADTYVVDMVGILVLREIGVLIVAIMVAGRSGSSYTAELGSMRMREEIDALRTMGFDPVEVLIAPRILALMIALPILTFLGSMSALVGAAGVAATYGGMTLEIFVSRLKEAVSVTHFEVGMIKAPFMALATGVVACAEGLAVRGSAESLGLHTTASVVKAIFLVIVLDGLFAIFFAAIGM